MDLYLIRHGIAEERGIYPNDYDRPLTEKGKEKTFQVANTLGLKGLKFEIIFTSPLIRALQTAEILQKSGLSDLLEIDLSLTPDGNLETWLLNWQKSQYNQGNQDNVKIALVGHQPNLGQWAEQLLWGKSQDKIILKKAGVIGINFPLEGNPIGNSELFLLTSPKYLIS
jgi:phosphohistidine phosphatase